MARARLRADQIRDPDLLTEAEHAALVHQNLTSSGILNFQDGTISGTGDIYCNDLYTSNSTIYVGTGEIKSTNGNIELNYSSSKVMETISDGIQVNDILEPYRVTEIKQNTDIFQIINRQHNGGLQIKCEDSNGTERPLFYGAANGTNPRVYLYAGGGVNVFSTSDDGAEGGINIIRGSAVGTSGATVTINSNSKDFFLRNNYDGGIVKIQGDSTAGTQVNMMVLDPHGSWTFASRNSGDTQTNTMMTLNPDGSSELHYAGVKKVETANYGFSFGANTISGTGDIYCNDIHTAAGSVYLGNLKLSSTDGETLLVNDSEITTSSGSGVTTFIELTDTPSTYDNGKYLRSTTSGVEWATVSGAGGGLNDLDGGSASTVYTIAQVIDGGDVNGE